MVEPALSSLQQKSYCWSSVGQANDPMSHEWSAHRMLPCGPDQTIRFRTLALREGASLNRLAFDGAVRVQPLARANVLLLQMPVRGQAQVAFDGRSVLLHGASIGVMEVPRVTECLYGAGFDMLVLRVPMASLAQRLEQWLQHPLRQALHFEPVLAEDSPAWAAWGPMRAAAEALEQSPPALLPAAVLDSLYETLLATILHALPHNYLDELRDPARRLAPRHVKRAEAYMREHADQALSLPRLAQQVGVSPRSLFDGFVAVHSLTPAQFLRRLRLQLAREALDAGDGPVAEVALRCGFRHAGRFASHYRQHFGEPPSQTVRDRSAGLSGASRCDRNGLRSVDVATLARSLGVA